MDTGGHSTMAGQSGSTKAVLLVGLTLWWRWMPSSDGYKHVAPVQIDDQAPKICKGLLSNVQCNCTEVRVYCFNAQIRSVEWLALLVEMFPNAVDVTFRGNNLRHLPERAVANSTTLRRLKTLNLSANWLTNVHPLAFDGMPLLEVLDLSENELSLNESNVHTLEPLPNLKRLSLRNAFRSDPNVAWLEMQMQYLEDMLRTANLRGLKVLDLSLNNFVSMRPTLFCPVGQLTHIYLANNRLRTLQLDVKCLSNLKLLDLRHNHFSLLQPETMHMIRSLQVNTVHLNGNPFECYCNSSEFIRWLNETDEIFDKSQLTCEHAWPRTFRRRTLMTVEPDRLQCLPWTSGQHRTLSTSESVLRLLTVGWLIRMTTVFAP